MSVEEILSDLSVIFSASIDTMTNAIEYGLLLLTKYPNMQELVYNELIDVLGGDGNDGNKDNNNEINFNFKLLNKLNIFKAFIHELLRISCVAATGVPHQIRKNIIIEHNNKKYLLPKDSLIHYNTFFIQKKQLWDPIADTEDINNITGSSRIINNNINNNNKLLGRDNNGIELENNCIHLEYWLNKNNNNKFELNNNFILFGTGLRDCVGQSYAKKTIYAIFGMLILKYKFIPPNNDTNLINLKQKWGLVQSIENNINISFQPRAVV